MRKKIKIASFIIFFGVLVGLIGYRWNYGFWPPRTPQKVISQISKIELPPNSEILLFREGESSFVMDDEFIVALVKPNDTLFREKLYTTGDFVILTDSIMTHLPIPKDVKIKYFSQKGIKGKYELNKQPGNTSLLLVDEIQGYYFLLIEYNTP